MWRLLDWPARFDLVKAGAGRPTGAGGAALLRYDRVVSGLSVIQASDDETGTVF